MVFSSLIFLFLFLPATLAIYYLCPPRGRNLVVTTASLGFFAWGAPRFVFVLLASCAADFLLARRAAPGAAPLPARRLRVGLAIALNLGLLLYFKYANFAVEQLNALRALLDVSPLVWNRVLLPIGISFFTFQKISYLIDVFRGTAEPARSYDRYLLYVALFPQLIAGPIVRYQDVALQIDRRTHDTETFLSGAWRFALGMARKVLLANPAGHLADLAFEAHGQVGCLGAWIGIHAYALQIYFDFAGYSDMAIGLGRMFGFQFLENFDFPYVARSVTEFWRRWHISLSTWMRDYLYIPLGGNRGSLLRVYANLWIVFAISGFWHGASWNFVAWGLFHGLLLSLERAVRWRFGRWPVPAVIGVPWTYLLVLLGWVLFRAADLSDAGAYLAALAGRVPAAAAATAGFAAELGDPRNLTVLIVGSVAACAPLLGLRRLVDEWPVGAPPGAARLPAALVARGTVTALLLWASATALAAGGFNPFIYYRF